MSAKIHPSAMIDPSAQLGDGVEIGPWAIVGPRVTLSDGVCLGPRVSVVCNTRIGPRVRVGEGSIVGGDPQDLKFQGEETWVEIGAGTVIREYATVNRGTAASGKTTVGEGCLIMTYVHLAHDCHIGNGVIISNATQLAGHVTVQDYATISGLNGIHQFVTIGAYAFIGGVGRVNQDIPPYVKAVGNRLYGLNVVGLQRAGFAAETIAALKRAYRLCFNSELNLTLALERTRAEQPLLPEVARFADFLETSSRGVPA